MIEHKAVERIRHAAQQRNPDKVISMRDVETCDAALLDAYLSGKRVRVAGKWGTRTGRVSVSLGWVPVLLLIYRSNQRGSSDVLGPTDKVV